MNKPYIIIVLLLFVSCSQHSSNKPIQNDLCDTLVTDTVKSEVSDTTNTPIETSPNATTASYNKRFSSSEEAYNEGYYNGHQEGYSDALHHLSFGYYYNDEPEYSGFLELYVEGYANGYEDGFNEGLEWDYENE